MKVVNLLLNEEEDDIRNYIITYLIIKLKVSQGCMPLWTSQQEVNYTV